MNGRIYRYIQEKKTQNQARNTIRERTYSTCGLLFCCPKETFCILLGILLQSHIESYSPHLLPYKIFAYSLEYFCNPTSKVTTLLQSHIESYYTHLLPYKPKAEGVVDVRLEYIIK